MKFCPLDGNERSMDALITDHKAAKEIGAVSLGEENLYFRKGRKVYYIPYPCISRAFRRVMLVPAKLCCGRGNLQVEYLVICSKEVELAQIGLPGTRAAKGLMEELKRKIPNADFKAPSAVKKE